MYLSKYMKFILTGIKTRKAKNINSSFCLDLKIQIVDNIKIH